MMTLKKDSKAKKIFFVSECILNQNIRAYGVGNIGGSGAVTDIAELIVSNGFGITIVPCPEIPYEGLKRNACNKEPYENPIYQENCINLAKRFVERYKMYLDDNYKVGGFICVNGSPSCAIDYCFRGKDVCEKSYESGVFIEEVKKQLREDNLDLTFIGMQSNAMPTVLEKIKKCIEIIEIIKD